MRMRMRMRIKTRINSRINCSRPTAYKFDYSKKDTPGFEPSTFEMPRAMIDALTNSATTAGLLVLFFVFIITSVY